MAQKWTDKQDLAIKLKNRRLLVSAAAGSGKTAVLVERIIQSIIDEENPIDVDELLVMTFTKAAAAEMKERILKSIEGAMDRYDHDSTIFLNLRRQAASIESAHIMTIDSFCLSVIRDHIAETDLDPAFRLADDSETTLLKADIMDELLEDKYSTADEDFIEFVESFATGAGDATIGGLIMSLYNYAQSTPWPEEWYENLLTDTEKEAKSEEDLLNSVWMKYVIDTAHMMADGMLKKIEYALTLCDEEGGPQCYKENLVSDRTDIMRIKDATDYHSLNTAIQTCEFTRLHNASKDVDAELKEIVKGIRNQNKDTIKGGKTTTMVKLFTVPSEDRIIGDAKVTGRSVATLLKLASEFDRRYSEKKKEKGVVDFNDLEHMALEILWDNDDSGHRVKSKVALEYAEQFKEIYVDEYQDSNYVQEELLTAIESGCVFMVGDIKQSIYGFRQARPELFNHKHHTYAPSDKTAEHTDTVIELATNFRSRKTVLDSVNDMFKHIMIPEVGGVEYTDDVALYYGANYKENDKGYTPGNTRCLICDIEDMDKESDSARDAEARMIAEEIKKLMSSTDGMQVWDNSLDAYRPCKYSDIVILLRSQKNCAEEYVNTLMDQGIPAYAQTGSGYFDTTEIKVMLSTLEAVDDPYKDIPLTAYLHSPLIGMDELDLANIRSAYMREEHPDKTQSMYDALKYAADSDVEKSTKDKCIYALSLLNDLSDRSVYMKLSELMTYIYDETGYLNYASALPAGDVRRANLKRLTAMADAYADTGYRGLFNFIRYVDNLKKYNTDMGEATTLGEYDNLVRIMTIHKSKGLEFPICFVSAADKGFNTKDLEQTFLTDADFGVGCDYVDTELRIKDTTLKKNIIKFHKKIDELGEELRVLYVAMTRAKEQLYITGCMKKAEEKLGKKGGYSEYYGGPDMMDVINASCYLDWVLLAYPYAKESIDLRVEPISALIEAEEDVQDNTNRLKTYLDGLKQKTINENESHIKEIMEYVYPYTEDIDMHSKMSVSQLKNMHKEEVPETDYVPEYAKPVSGISAAERGNAYHKLMELLDYEAVTDEKTLSSFCDELVKESQLSQEEADALDKQIVLNWIHSELGSEVAKAYKAGTLRREAQFMMGLPASEIMETQSEEMVIIQGVIDAYIEHEDGITLIDYKTDRVADTDTLKNRYEIQLKLYAEALRKMKHKEVKMSAIWSFALSQALIL